MFSRVDHHRHVSSARHHHGTPAVKLDTRALAADVLRLVSRLPPEAQSLVKSLESELQSALGLELGKRAPVDSFS